MYGPAGGGGGGGGGGGRGAGALDSEILVTHAPSVDRSTDTPNDVTGSVMAGLAKTTSRSSCRPPAPTAADGVVGVSDSPTMLVGGPVRSASYSAMGSEVSC